MASPPEPRRRRPVPFRPRFTLMLLYVAAFYFVFALALALPALLEALKTLPPGAEPPTREEIEVASEAARAVVDGKLRWVFVAAVAATALGAWRGLLPGLRPPTP